MRGFGVVVGAVVKSVDGIREAAAAERRAEGIERGPAANERVGRRGGDRDRHEGWR